MTAPPVEAVAPAKKKINRLDYIFQQKNGETLMKVPGQIDGRAFAIRYLENCKVYLYDHAAQITVDQCKNCTFVVGPIKGSIFLRDCQDCEIHVACQQFRCRDLINSSVYLYTSNDPIIEASNGLKFAPFNIGYPGLKAHAEAAGLTTENKWELVFDFSSGKGENVANHSQIAPEEWSTELQEIPDYQGDDEPALYFEYPLRYGGTLSNEPPLSTKAEEENAFSIHTSAHEAQAVVDSKPTTSAAEVASAQPEAQTSSSYQNPLEAVIAQPEPAAAQEQAIAASAEPMAAFMAPPVTQPPVEMQMQMQYQEPVVQQQQPVAMQMQAQDNGGYQQFQDFTDSNANENAADPFGSAVPEQIAPVMQDDGEDYTAEEREMMQAAELNRQALQQALFTKQTEELANKNARRNAGSQAIAEFQSERTRQTQQRRQNNIQIEKAREAEQAKDREGMNPWDRITKNCDLTKTISPGGRDLTRMKSAMLNRKADLNNKDGASGAAGSNMSAAFNF